MSTETKKSPKKLDAATKAAKREQKDHDKISRHNKKMLDYMEKQTGLSRGTLFYAMYFGIIF